MNYAYIDFEYYNTSEEFVTPVCGVIYYCKNVYRYWLHDSPEQQQAMADYLRCLIAQKVVFVSYAFEAEARAMQALRLGPILNQVLPFCLYIMYRQLGNGFDDIQYGKHLVDGVVKYLKKPKSKWDQGEEEDLEEGESRSEMQYGLASATYKLTGNIRDTDDKDRCRDRILKGGPYSPEDKTWILNYCEEDVKFLPELHSRMWDKYRELVGVSEPRFIDLSKYAIATAEMVRIGYPINRAWLQRISDSIPWLLRDMQRDLLRQSRELSMPFEPFAYVKGTGEFKRNDKLIKDYVKAKYPNAKLTEKGNICLDEEALDHIRTPEHLPRQFVDYLRKYNKLKQSLTGFKPAKGKKCIWDYVGSDDRIRPYFGIFGSQTSRSQPSSTGFIFLKSKVLRFLVQPKEGKIVFGIDYSSQEYLINAILSGDQNMINAYASGDVYLYLGKKIGLVPQEGIRADYEPQRELCKALELALSFGMGAASCSARIGTSEETAAELMQSRAELYSDLTSYRRGLVQQYKQGPLHLSDGWALGPDQENRLSMQNFPTQGTGAVVLREAVRRCQALALPVIFTLHDALYFECNIADVEQYVMTAHRCMIEAFRAVLGMRDAPIRAEVHAWGFPIEKRETRTYGGIKVDCDPTYYDGKKDMISEHYKWVSFVRESQFLI